MDYVMRILKIGGDIPKSDIKSTEIIVTNPSYELLEHYLKKFISQAFMTTRHKFTINPKKTKEFNFNLTEDDLVTKQLNNTAMLSYLMYENGEVIIDEISPVYAPLFL